MKLLSSSVAASALLLLVGQTTTSGVDARTTFQLIKSSVDCHSNDIELTPRKYTLTKAQCAGRCAAIPDCKYFLFGKNAFGADRTGYCWHEFTTTACNAEGFLINQPYDFYRLNRSVGPPPTSPTPPTPPTPPPSGNEFLPSFPSTAGKRACTTRINGFQGICMNGADCPGGVFNDVCGQSWTTKCCVKETTPARPSAPHLSFSLFKQLFPAPNQARWEALWPYFNEALDALLEDRPSANTKCHRIAAFAAQLTVESVGLTYFEEIASGAGYEGWSALGNTQPGDGRRFKGRGPIQLTGRANYQRAKDALGFDYTGKPEQVCFPSQGFKTSAFYWTSHNLNQYCDGNHANFVTLTRRINGGTNGLHERQAAWATAKSQLGCR